MRSTIVLVLSLLFARETFAQVNDPDILARDSFPSFVKSVTLSGFIMFGGPEEDTLLDAFMSVHLEFDAKGDWIIREDLFEDGTVSRDCTWYEANTRTRFLKHRETFDSSLTATAYNADGSVNSIFFSKPLQDNISRKFDYDKKKRLTRITETYADQEKVEQFTYNKSGQQITKTTSFGSPNEKKRIINNKEYYTYNDAGDRTQTLIEYYGANDIVRVRDTILCTYDEMHRLIFQRESRQDGKNQVTFAYQYDTKGNITVKDCWYRPGGEEPQHVTYTMEYDEYGYYTLTAEEGTSQEGDVYGDSRNWRVTYNEKGLPVYCYCTTNSEILYYTWEYEFR